jgi:hypothetical protein
LFGWLPQNDSGVHAKAELSARASDVDGLCAKLTAEYAGKEAQQFGELKGLYGETPAELAKAPPAELAKEPPVPSKNLEPMLEQYSEVTNNIVGVQQDHKDSQNIPTGAGQVSEAMRRYKQELKSEQVVTSSSISGDGKTLAVVEDSHPGYRDNKSTVIVRSVTTGAELQKLPHEHSVTSMSLYG